MVNFYNSNFPNLNLFPFSPNMATSLFPICLQTFGRVIIPCSRLLLIGKVLTLPSIPTSVNAKIELDPLNPYRRLFFSLQNFDHYHCRQNKFYLLQLP